MKKKFFNMIALLLFITGVQASCNKEDSPVTSPPAAGTDTGCCRHVRQRCGRKLGDPDGE